VTTLRNRQPDDWRKRTSHAPQSVHQALQDGLLLVVSAVDGAQCSGAVELDDRGRRNIIWLAGEPTGFRYEAGIPVGPTDAVKVVLSSEARKVHAFPVTAAHRAPER